ncbi:MAG: pyridoxal-phosphate dependent enzyme, partial [Acidobacteriota bacterium]
MIAKRSTSKIPRRLFLQSSIAAAVSTPGIGFSQGTREGLSRLLNDRFRRQPISHIPTPLEQLRSLADALGCRSLLIKRDDQTGLALGGNKARKLDYIMADVIREKADTIVTTAGIQSNWCRQTAAAARMFGIDPVLVLVKRDASPVEYEGNLLLDFLFNADVRFLEPNADRNRYIADTEAELRRAGRRPYVAPIGGSMPGGSMRDPLGALGYVNAFLEMHGQAAASGISLDGVVLASGSGGTQAGLVVGARAVSPKTRVVGVSVSGSRQAVQKTVAAIANLTAAALDLKDKFAPE